jgi:putative ABC transport system permease protein
MYWTAFITLLSHWRANPWQLLTLIAGLAMATALWSGVQAINSEARASYAAASDQLTQAGAGRITSKNGVITVDDFVTLRRAGWQVSPVLEGRIEGVLLVGIDPVTFPRGESAPTGSDRMGDLLTPKGLVITHSENAERLKDLGPDILIDDMQSNGRAITDIATAQTLLNRFDFTALVVGPSQPLGVLDLDEITPDLTLNSQTQSDVSRLTDSFHLNLTAFGLLSFAVGIFIVYGAIGLAFEQRRPVFRTLRALGLSLRSLITLLALELTTFALVAGTIGIALGYLVAASLLPDVAATLRGLYGAEVTGTLAVRASWWASGLGMALFGTATAAIGAFAKLTRMPLMASASPRAMVMDASRTTRILALMASLLILIAIMLALFGSGLIAGFTMLGCLLVGAALVLPPLLNLALKTAETLAKSPLSQWFWADTRQQLPGLSMALMALLLAMAANIGVSTMVSSFRLTFTGYLDQRLSSELYLRFDTVEKAREVVEFVTPEVDAVLPIISQPIRVADLPAEVFGIIDHATYRDYWPMLEAVPNVWDQLHQGQGILVNEQLARRQNLWVGSDLDSEKIIGVYSDYGNSSGQIIMDKPRFDVRYPQAEALRFGLRTSDPDRISDLLQARFDLGPDGIINQQGIKNFSLGVFERTFAVTAALNILTLSVAGLAILISLLTLAAMRLPQLAPVWALGLTRRKLAGLEMVRALVLAAFTGLAAIPLGLALAWVLLAIVNVEAFGWRLPMYLFPLDYTQLGLLTLIAAALAALWPAMRLARTPPGDLLKVFSNER